MADLGAPLPGSIGRIEKWMSLNDAQGLAMIKLNRNARNAF